MCFAMHGDASGTPIRSGVAEIAWICPVQILQISLSKTGSP